VELNKPSRFSKLEIAPFILLAFAENAFKHGANNQAGENLISINLKIDGSKLFYEVTNTTDNAGLNDENRIKEGIGLQNLRKRLELQYADHYDLRLSKRGSRFYASLVLELSTQSEEL